MKFATSLIVLFFCSVLLTVELYGRASRRGEERPASVSVESPAGAYHQMKNRGHRGRTAVVLSKRLYFEVKEPATLVPPWMRYPLSVFNLSTEMEKSLSDRNFLWVAMDTGVIRSIVHVLPGDVFQERLKEAPSYRRVTVGEGTIRAPILGSPRMLVTLDSLPKIDEPVIVFADAAFFDAIDAESAARAVRNRMSPVLVITCAPDDGSPVTDAQRRSLDTFSALVVSHGS